MIQSSRVRSNGRQYTVVGEFHGTYIDIVIGNDVVDVIKPTLCIEDEHALHIEVESWVRNHMGDIPRLRKQARERGEAAS